MTSLESLHSVAIGNTDLRICQSGAGEMRLRIEMGGIKFWVDRLIRSCQVPEADERQRNYAGRVATGFLRRCADRRFCAALLGRASERVQVQINQFGIALHRQAIGPAGRTDRLGRRQG
jgi:hypothetical protein